MKDLIDNIIKIENKRRLLNKDSSSRMFDYKDFEVGYVYNSEEKRFQYLCIKPRATLDKNGVIKLRKIPSLDISELAYTDDNTLLVEWASNIIGVHGNLVLYTCDNIEVKQASIVSINGYGYGQDAKMNIRMERGVPLVVIYPTTTSASLEISCGNLTKVHRREYGSIHGCSCIYCDDKNIYISKVVLKTTKNDKTVIIVTDSDYAKIKAICNPGKLPFIPVGVNETVFRVAKDVSLEDLGIIGVMCSNEKLITRD